MSEWQEVAPSTFRLEVEGGWLYRYDYRSNMTPGQNFAPILKTGTIVFVPKLF